MNRHPQISEFEQYVINFVLDLRTTKDLTQQNIADILQTSREFIASIENPNKHAKYNLDHINALADYFNISPREFLPKKAFPV